MLRNMQIQTDKEIETDRLESRTRGTKHACSLIFQCQETEMPVLIVFWMSYIDLDIKTEKNVANENVELRKK